MSNTQKVYILNPETAPQMSLEHVIQFFVVTKIGMAQDDYDKLSPEMKSFLTEYSSGE